MRWTTGETAVERLLATGHIERVQGAAADGASWLERARRSLEAAQVLSEPAPDSSVVLTYDAARQACVALLAQQGLRPTTAGGGNRDLRRRAASTISLLSRFRPGHSGWPGRSRPSHEAPL
jgi:hypothetical protein